MRPDVTAIRWQHTIELPDGVVTPGRWDARSALDRVPLPASLEGRRCLSVATDDGFWAFELERRGAQTVLFVEDDAARWDWPAHAPAENVEQVRRLYAGTDAFEIARGHLGSRVEHVRMSTYDLCPASVGEFDFAVVASALFHLRDPVRALTAVASVIDNGELLFIDHVSVLLSVLRPRQPAADLSAHELPHWWAPNIAGLRRLVEAAGFEVLRTGGPYLVRRGTGYDAHAGGPAKRPSSRRMLLSRAGVPHGWVLARAGSAP